jgi:threonine/homoserine/homoserine lactone efflux protein
MSWEFLLTSLIVVVSPGTGVLYTLATALSRGGLASIAAAFGCTLGILPHLAASILGLAALLHASAEAFEILKIAGVCYLLYLAWITWRDRSQLSVETAGRPREHRRIVLRGFLINILNPKLSIFFLAFLPQFVAADAAAPALQMTWLAVVFMAMTFVVFVGYGLAAASVRRQVIERPRVMTWLRRLFAGAFAGLGLKLALSER